MIFARIFVLYCLLDSAVAQYSTSIGGIGAVRFSRNTNVYEEGRDGVLEVNYKGTWGTVCNYGFDELAASTACFMMGFPPRGIPILNSVRYSTLPVVISNFNCTGRVKLPSSKPSTATVHLGVCSFTDEIPEECSDKQRQTSVFCIDSVPVLTTTTSPPNLATIPPVDCSNPKSSIIRLIGGTDNSGLVQIQRPDTNEWGTICADGFEINVARTLCRMLCTSSDNLQYAYPVLYKYGHVGDSVPIHLSRLSCPADATDLNQCSLGGGWGAVGLCTHVMDVGLQCGPQRTVNSTTIYTPELVCEHAQARIRYDKKYNQDLNTSMIKLIGDTPTNCQFKVLETEAFIEAIVPLEGCGGSLLLSNESTIAIKLKVIREYLAPESEIITNLPVQFDVICLIPRVNHIQPGTLVSPEVVSTLSGDSQQTEASVQLYSDAGFSLKLPEGNTIRPGEQVNALVSVKNPPSATKLVLEDCWATANADRQSRPRVDLIVNRCAVYEDLTVHPISRTEVGFSFPAFYLGTAGSVVPISNNLSLHCDTRICQTSETSTFCQQFCSTTNRAYTTASLRRQRRDLNAMLRYKNTMLNGHRSPVHIQQGQVHIR